MADDGLIYRIGGCAAAILDDGESGFRGRFLEGPAQGLESTSSSMAKVIADLRKALQEAKTPALPV